MNDTQLDSYIDKIKKQALPACPERLNENVLRRIRVAKNVSVENPLWFLLPKSAFITGIASIMILMTAVTTVSISSLKNNRITQRHLAVKSLDFDVFNRPHLLDTRQAKR